MVNLGMIGRAACQRRPSGQLIAGVARRVEIDFTHPFLVAAQFHVVADVIHQLLGRGNGLQRDLRIGMVRSEDD